MDHLWVDGVGGYGFCEFDSGREHLWQLFTRSCHFLTPPAVIPGLFLGVGCGGVQSLCSFVLLFLLSVCVTSYEGHMVDALASRADEGRRSLR